MNRDKKLRKITEHVWDFIYFKLVLTSERPVIKTAPCMNTEMIKLLRMIVWTGTYVSLSEWRGFLYDHYVHMTSSPKDFATYVVYALYITKQTSEQNGLDAFQIFLRTISLVVQFSLYSNEDRQAELLPMAQEIFIEFFEKELKNGFNKQGGWNALFDYLQDRNPLQLFKMLESWEEEGYTPGQIVGILGMINSSMDPLKEHLSRGIKSSEVESYLQSSRILNSLDFLHEIKCDKLGLNDTSKKTGDTCVKDCSKQEPPSRSSEQKSNSATESGVNIKHSKEMFQETKVKPNGRITTREVYLRAKYLMQDLQLDFHKLEDLLDFVFRDAAVESKLFS